MTGVVTENSKAMKYYLLMTTGDFRNEDQLFLEDRPTGMGIFDYRLSFGEVAAPFFPPRAKVYVRPENRGRKLFDIVGNSRSYFIGSDRVRKLLQDACQGLPCEFFPFSICDDEGDLISDDYFFINPLMTVDCLHYGLSVISGDFSKKGFHFEQMVLDKRKVDNFPLLFRIKDMANFYVFSSLLAERFAKEKITNFISEKLPIA